MKKIFFERIKREAFIRYAYFKRLTKVPYLPTFVSIEPTNYCNYKCLMCPQSAQKSNLVPRGFMSEHTFSKILDEIKFFAFEVFIQLGGEPLLHPKLLDFIRRAKKERLLVGFSSNGSLLNTALDKSLIEAGLDKLIITFTDKGAERYRRIWQGGDYIKVEKNIKELLALKNGRRNPRIILQIIKFFGEDKDLSLEKDFLEQWQRRGVDSFSPVWATYWAGDFKEEAEVRYGQAPRDNYYHPCGAIWRSLAIHWDGKVSPCCNDLCGDYILGDIWKEPISAIWNGEKMVGLRDGLARCRYKEITLCQNCRALWGRLPDEKRKWWGGLENRIKTLGLNFPSYCRAIKCWYLDKN